MIDSHENDRYNSFCERMNIMEFSNDQLKCKGMGIGDCNLKG